MAFVRALLVSALALMLVACKGEYTTNTSTTTTNPTTAAPNPPPATDTTVTGTVTAVPPDPCNQPVKPGGTVQMPPISITGNIPVIVPLPAEVNSPLQVRPNFDWFSWTEFIALNWPASSQGRGNPQSPNDPSVFMNAKPGTPTVWSTYKANWELFDQGGARPTEFDSWEVADEPLCTVKDGERALVMSSKGNTVLNDGVEAFSFPLVDAHQNYLMFEVRYGRAAYDFMRGKDGDPETWLYFAKNLSPPTQQAMPSSTQNPNVPGAIMMKAAWRDMSDVPPDQQGRYYVSTAQVYDPATKQCNARQVGLVGLHIAQKVSDLPEWVWSTFEQVDVLTTTTQPQGLLAPCATGDTNCSQVHGFANRPQSTELLPDKSKRVPVNVARINPIPTTPTGAGTDVVNAAFQKALAGTVWANYQLIVTQWPFNPTQFKAPESRGIYPCWSGDPFPTADSVNVTMETYFQNATDAIGSGMGGNSCMGCHYGAALYDYSWGLKRRPHADK